MKKRVKLTEGERCVLCGSTSHPLKKMANPDKYQKALVAQQNLEKQRSYFEIQLQSSRAKVTSLRTSNSFLIVNKKTIERN